MKSISLTRIAALTLFAVAITLLATAAIPNRLAAKPPQPGPSAISGKHTAGRSPNQFLNELAYDYPDSVVIGYSPTDRGIEAIVAISARADGVFLYLSHGPQLPDPKKLLQGSGKKTRFIRVDAAGQLGHPDVEALIVQTGQPRRPE